MRALMMLAMILALALPAAADDCTTWSTSSPEINANGLFYVDNDNCPECIFSVWIYQESNGIAGLQRGDEVKDDTCHGMIVSDRKVIF